MNIRFYNISRTMAAHYLVLAALLLFITVSEGYAQKKATAKRKATATANKKPARPVEEIPSLDFEDMLPTTAKLMVIDSVVVSKADFIKHIPLDKACGTAFQNPIPQDVSMVFKGNGVCYVNEFRDRCFFSDSTLNRDRLYMSDRIGGKWLKPKAIEEFAAEYKDISYPYMMQDGVTLYFSAVNKNLSFGKRDIFMARFDTDSLVFYKPDNIGLPYNSAANDYCCIIDDSKQLGWLVSDRFQPHGKVCIYTFIPSDERWAESNPTMTEQHLKPLAMLSPIAKTQYDENKLKTALAELSELKTHNGNADTNTYASKPFVISDGVVYHSVSDFKSPTNAELYAEYLKLKDEQADETDLLETLRSDFRNKGKAEKNSLAAQILRHEETVVKRQQQIHEMEKKIRNAENLVLRRNGKWNIF